MGGGHAEVAVVAVFIQFFMSFPKSHRATKSCLFPALYEFFQTSQNSRKRIIFFLSFFLFLIFIVFFVF